MSPETDRRVLSVDATYSLAETCGPVAWARGRWPNVDWIAGSLVWIGWEGDRVVDRRVAQSHDQPGFLTISGSASAALDESWARAALGIACVPPLANDEIVASARARYPGLRPWANGTLFEGLVGSIVGQSITVAAAAVTENRLSALFHNGVGLAGRVFRPTPRPEHLGSADASLIRQSGVTW